MHRSDSNFIATIGAIRANGTPTTITTRIINAGTAYGKCSLCKYCNTAKFATRFIPSISTTLKMSKVIRVTLLYANTMTNNMARNVFTCSNGRVQGHFSVRMMIVKSVTIIKTGIEKLNAILFISLNPSCTQNPKLLTPKPRKSTAPIKAPITTSVSCVGVNKR